MDVAARLAATMGPSTSWRDMQAHWQMGMHMSCLHALHDVYGAEAAGLRAAVVGSCRSMRDVAAWHCEPMRPQWEMQNARAWLDNLHSGRCRIRVHGWTTCTVERRLWRLGTVSPCASQAERQA
eukprot:384996-Pelagomonas_calceolata.AAC.1